MEITFVTFLVAFADINTPNKHETKNKEIKIWKSQV